MRISAVELDAAVEQSALGIGYAYWSRKWNRDAAAEVHHGIPGAVVFRRRIRNQPIARRRGQHAAGRPGIPYDGIDPVQGRGLFYRGVSDLRDARNKGSSARQSSTASQVSKEVSTAASKALLSKAPGRNNAASNGIRALGCSSGLRPYWDARDG